MQQTQHKGNDRDQWQRGGKRKQKGTGNERGGTSRQQERRTHMRGDGNMGKDKAETVVVEKRDGTAAKKE